MDVGLVCDACSALTPIGVPQCKRCGLPVALDPRAKIGSSPPPIAAASTVPCPKCREPVQAGHRFCHSCGAKVPSPSPFTDVDTKVGPRPPGASSPSITPPPTGTPSQPQPAVGSNKVGRSTLFFGGAMQAARAKLTLIRGDGEDGVSFTLAGQDHLAGRGDCPISFPEDPFLSPTHANFCYSGNTLVVRDEGSLNGVYVRITGKAELVPGATVLVGEQVLKVMLAKTIEDTPDPDGTYYSASMPRPAALEVYQYLRGGALGWVFRVGDTATLGRENNDINFPDDPFISGRHAEIKLAGGALSVTDLGSRNGTFVRVNGEQVLRHGDYVFLGQQLLRVEIV
jgi:pSer/pThr/pTyr-binding forkhead associated (FHA) protein